MKTLSLLIVSFFCSFAIAESPARFTDLLDYVQEAPDQGESATCLYVASTGAMELIANKKEDIRHPMPYGKYDLAESFLINAPIYPSKDKTFWEVPVLKFNNGFGIHISEWPYEPWNETSESSQPWNSRNYRNLPHVPLPKVETIPLFAVGNRWSTNVLEEKHVQTIKDALVKYRSPILMNYNDSRYWHVILIVGYDDDLPGNCYQISDKECGTRRGSFYVRDSFGVPVEVRDYDWFRVKANAAFVVKEAE